MQAFHFIPGDSPLLVSMPHVGTGVPPEIAARLTPEAAALPDTDWHVDQLYDFLDTLGAARLQATQSRYVIDLNRAPDDRPLYAAARNTELCPTTTFAEQPIYRSGAAPDATETAARRAAYWRPYHDRLRSALDEVRARHGVAVLWEAHSIRSRVPRFFAGRLPDLNLGTAGGKSAAAALLSRLTAVAAESGYSHAVNGRFQGGYITRAYGNPARGIHAVQLELSQITYMDEDPPFVFRENLAAGTRPVLRRLLETALDWAGSVIPP